MQNYEKPYIKVIWAKEEDIITLSNVEIEEPDDTVDVSRI